MNKKSHLSRLETIIDDAGLKADQAEIIRLYDYLKDSCFPDLTPDQISLTSSSGSSVVLLFNNPMHPVVYQYYHGYETYDNIVKMQNHIKNNLSQSITQTFVSPYDQSVGLVKPIIEVTTAYDLTNSLTLMRGHFPELQTIIWERIKPLHEIPINIIKPFLGQLIWDIDKALYGLHSIGYSHGDSRYDNIGLKNGKFVLFDYNLSKLQGNKERDYELLFKSLRFHFNQDSDKIISSLDTNLDYNFYSMFDFYRHFLINSKRSVSPSLSPAEIVNWYEEYCVIIN